MTLVTVAILILLCVSVPIGIAFALPSIVGAGGLGISPDLVGASVSYNTATSFTLIAIPCFVLAGQIMNDGGLMIRLVRLAQSFLGWLRGSLGYVTIVASAMLGSITGSSVATVAAVSTAVGEEMTKRGFNRDYVAALAGCCGLLGVLIPPSIPLIVYSAIVGESVGDLFLATLVPGLLMVLAFIIVHRLLLSRALKGESKPAAKETVRPIPALRSALPALLMPVLLLGGIYSGMMTPTEAAALAVAYGVIAAVMTGGIKVTNLHRVFLRAALPSAAILSIIVFSSSFNQLVTLERVPQEVTTFAIDLTSSPIVFLLIINVVLFVIGMFMETNAAVLLMGPLLAPAAAAFEIDPVHFGIVLVSSIELGLITPPMAINLYVAAKQNCSSLVGMLPYVGRFLAAGAVVILLITYLPALTTWHL